MSLVTVSIKARSVKVKGPRGELSRSFKYVPLTLTLVGKKKVRAEMFFGRRLQLAAIRTVLSHIKNMIVGVTKGYEYKMRMVYAHFPINISFENNNKTVEIRNFLGEKVVRTVELPEGVTIERSEDVKDQIVLTGNDIEAVSQSGMFLILFFNLYISLSLCSSSLLFVFFVIFSQDPPLTLSLFLPTTAAKIHHIARPRNKDIRKFLDGIYVSESGLLENN